MPHNKKNPVALKMPRKISRRQSELFALTGNPLFLLTPLRKGRMKSTSKLEIEPVKWDPAAREFVKRTSPISDRKKARKKGTNPHSKLRS
jgi:anaerobic selenocysteine-containing dehydrogenase